MKGPLKAAAEEEGASHCKPLLDILRNQVLPWSQAGMDHVIIGTPTLADFHALNTRLPAGVTVSRKKLGKRTALRGKRALEAYGPISAVWWDDNLCVKTEPVLACIVGGHADFGLGEYTAHCPAGTIILLPPGVPHPMGQSHLDSGKDSSHFCDVMWLSFWESMLRCWICHSVGDQHFFPTMGESAFVGQDNLTHHFRALVREAGEAGRHHQEVCGFLMCAVFTVLTRLLEEGRYVRSDGLKGLRSDKATEHGKGVTVRDYMRANLRYPLTLSSVGRAMGMSRTRMVREFSGKSGPTFIEYLTDLRVQEAQELLRTSDWPVSFIASLVGLSASRLRKVFQHANACSPNEYRQRSWKERHSEPDAPPPLTN